MKKGAVEFSETWVNFYRTTRRRIPEDNILHIHYCYNVKSYNSRINVTCINNWLLSVTDSRASTLQHLLLSPDVVLLLRTEPSYFIQAQHLVWFAVYCGFCQPWAEGCICDTSRGDSLSSVAHVEFAAVQRATRICGFHKSTENDKIILPISGYN